jgi:2-methylcitrate dehydratase PrpD
VTVAERLAVFLGTLAGGNIDARRADGLTLHLFDTLGALVAGMQVADAGVIARAMRGSHGGPAAEPASLPEIATMAAAIRSTEIDDIHLLAGVTPSAAIVPVLLGLAVQGNRITGADLLPAYLGGLEVMIRFARAAGGPHLLRSGIWPSRLSAGMGAAAATAILLGLKPAQTSHALAIAAAMASGFSPRGGVPSSRWLIFGRAVEDGVLAARSAAHGIRGEPALFDGQWSKATGIALDTDLLVAGLDGELLTEGLGLKPWCAARQTMAAIAGFSSLLRKQDLDAQALAEVLVEVPGEYAAMIDHQDMPSTRPATFANLRYLLGLAAFARDGLTDVRRDDLRIDSRFEALASIVRIEGSDDLSQSYPARWPARVTVVTADGQRHAVEVPDVPGDSVTPLVWEDVAAKCAAAAGVPVTVLDPLKNTCQALPRAASAANFRAATVAALGAVDITQGRAI